MTPEDFANRMRLIELRPVLNPGPNHKDADRLLVKALKEAGYGDGVAIYEALKKYYE